MTWITTISYEEASGALKKLYDRVKGPDNNVDNIMLAHSLRPHSMEGHMSLYKHVLHHPRNALAKSYLETIGVYVSLLNQCRYCIDHHYSGLIRLLQDDVRATAIRSALDNQDPAAAFDGKELAGLQYVEKLTTNSAAMSANDIEALRESGFDDGEILEINQVAAYFAYANRTVLGLGVSHEDEELGQSPSSDNPENWGHK